MKNYYNLFVKFSLQLCTRGDYKNRLRVMAHDVAFEKLRKLQDEMKRDSCSAEILCMLLNHEDDRVKVNAASLCLDMNILVNQADIVLKKMMETAKDPTMRFSAKMLLQKYK